jgi:hypothetical protein
MSALVMKLDSWDIRKTMSAATSSGCPARSSGVMLVLASRKAGGAVAVIGVSM